MSKFKIGDYIIGTEDNDYGITNQYNECIVVGFVEDIFGDEDLLRVQLAQGKRHTIYPVREEYFKHSRTKEVELIWKKCNLSKFHILGLVC